MNIRRSTKWLIGAYALSLAVFQPGDLLPENTPFNTVIDAEAATSTQPGKVPLKSVKAVSYNKIRINWKKTTGATHYRIYYKTPGGKWKLIKTVASDVTSYTHTSSKKYPIKCGQKYTYTVKAYNSKSKQTGSYNKKGLTVRTLPTAVSLRNVKRNSNNTVTVSWKKAYGGNYYRVYRKTPGSSWKLIGKVKSSSLSYTDKNPVKGKQNIYTVKMYNSTTKTAGKYDTAGIAVSVPKTSASASVKKPGKPVLTSISASGSDKVTIKWKKASNATNYRIYYKESGGKWKQIASVKSSATSYTHTSSGKYPIKAGKKYVYTVRAYNSNTKKLGSYDTKGLTVTIPKPAAEPRWVFSDGENGPLTVRNRKVYTNVTIATAAGGYLIAAPDEGINWERDLVHWYDWKCNDTDTVQIGSWDSWEGDLDGVMPGRDSMLYWGYYYKRTEADRSLSFYDWFHKYFDQEWHWALDDPYAEESIKRLNVNDGEVFSGILLSEEEALGHYRKYNYPSVTLSDLTTPPVKDAQLVILYDDGTVVPYEKGIIVSYDVYGGTGQWADFFPDKEGHGVGRPIWGVLEEG